MTSNQAHPPLNNDKPSEHVSTNKHEREAFLDAEPHRVENGIRARTKAIIGEAVRSLATLGSYDHSWCIGD